ncbi:MAG: hypothetical protein ACRDTH_06095 [Pseudonocardiaceae bacterium]
MCRRCEGEDVPDDLRRELRRRADLEGLSIRDYLLRLVRNDQQRPPATEWLARLRQLEPLDIGAPAADLVKADRAAPAVPAGHHGRAPGKHPVRPAADGPKGTQR